MIFAVEAYPVESPEEGFGDLDPDEAAEAAEFESKIDAMEWCWNRMEEGYQTRMWRR